jgi:hypothetical protein
LAGGRLPVHAGCQKGAQPRALQTPCAAGNVCRLGPLRRPMAGSTCGATMGRLASSASCAMPVWAARSYPKRVVSTCWRADGSRGSRGSRRKRMETPNSLHSARPRATKRLARFFEVNPAPASGFSIRMFLRTGIVRPAMGLRVCPQRELRFGYAYIVDRRTTERGGLHRGNVADDFGSVGSDWNGGITVGGSHPRASARRHTLPTKRSGQWAGDHRFLQERRDNGKLVERKRFAERQVDEFPATVLTGRRGIQARWELSSGAEPLARRPMRTAPGAIEKRISKGPRAS